MRRVADAIRPKPFRGDVVAAGVVVLATLVLLTETRFDTAWADGVHLAIAAASAALVTAMAVLAEPERPSPRPYQSVLYVASLGLALTALADLARVLGGEPWSAGTLTWVSAALACLAGWYATARGSAVATLIAAAAIGLAALAFVEWSFDPSSTAPFRWLLLVLMGVFALAALSQRDRRRRHAVALTDAAGLAALALALTFLAETALGGISGAVFSSDSGAVTALGSVDVARPGWGWGLLLFAVAFGLIAYAAVDREPGPGYLGVATLLATIAVVAPGGTSFLGWPLVLALGAGVLLAVGLRPTTPLPPEPESASAEPIDFTHHRHAPEDRT